MAEIQLPPELSPFVLPNCGCPLPSNVLDALMPGIVGLTLREQARVADAVTRAIVDDPKYDALYPKLVAQHRDFSPGNPRANEYNACSFGNLAYIALNGKTDADRAFAERTLKSYAQQSSVSASQTQAARDLLYKWWSWQPSQSTDGCLVQ